MPPTYACAEWMKRTLIVQRTSRLIGVNKSHRSSSAKKALDSISGEDGFFFLTFSINHPHPLLEAFQKQAHQFLPFLLQTFPGLDRLVCPPVPISGITQVTLHSVQVGMHPITRLRTGILSQVMRRVPISLSGPPKGFQVLGQSRWRLFPS